MSTEQTNSGNEDDAGDSVDEDFQDELSLEQLSQAYAQVMREQGHGGPSDENPEENASDERVEAETAQDVTTDTEKAGGLESLDAADNACCPISPESIVEAVLFVGAPAGVKISGRKLAAVMRDVSPNEVKQIVKSLNQQYESTAAAFRIVNESGDYKMKLADDLLGVQNYYFGRNRPAKLTQGAIDALAIVAYNQPVTRKQVDQIRSKPTGSMLSQLLKRDLIAIHNEEKKEATFTTTDRFLELFGLGTLEDLPQTSVVADLEELTDI